MTVIRVLLSLSDQYNGTTICPLAPALGAPMTAFIKKYRSEFEAYIEKNPNHGSPRICATYRPGAFW